MVTATGSFLPIQLIYQDKSKICLTKFIFPLTSMSCSQLITGRSYKSAKTFWISSSFLICRPRNEMKRLTLSWWRPLSYRNQSSFYMITASVMKELSTNNNCELVIAPHNFTNNFQVLHCVKSVPIRSYSAPHFHAFGLNTERYSVFSPNAGKCGPE